MELADLLTLVPLIPLLAVSGFCSASETALFSLTHHDWQRLRRSSPPAARAADLLFKHPRGLLVTVLLTNMAANVVYMVLTSIVVLRVQPPLVAAAVNVVSLLALILIAEVLAKHIASGSPLAVTRVVSRPLLVYHRFLTPIRTVLDAGMIAPLSRLLSPPREAAPPSLTADELAELIDLSAAGGEVDPADQRTLAQVIQLGVFRVRDAMIPRQEIVWLDSDAPDERLVDLLRATRHTHLPVRAPDADNPDGRVVGVLDAKRFLGARLVRGAPMAREAFITKAAFIPEQARLDQLLELLRRSKSDMALAVDEHGAVVGLIRSRDAIERLVQPLDEADAAPAAAAGIERIAPDAWRVPGRLGAAKWFPLLGRSPLAGASTLGGLVTQVLGRFPVPGDRITIGNLRLTVERVGGEPPRAVDTVIVSLLDSAERTARRGTRSRG